MRCIILHWQLKVLQKNLCHTMSLVVYSEDMFVGGLTFQLHADVHTLLEPAVGTPLPLGLVNDATPLRHAGVDLLVLHGPLEEALAGLAGEEAVVVAGHLGRCSQEKLIGKKVKVNF